MLYKDKIAGLIYTEVARVSFLYLFIHFILSATYQEGHRGHVLLLGEMHCAQTVLRGH